VANSAQVKSYVVDRDGVAPAMVWVHYNGVDIPILNELPQVPEPMCNYPAAVWIGIVASLTPVKRHDLLLRAFASIHSSVASGSVRVLVVGEGPERNALETLCRQLGIASHVHFVGATKEVGTYLRHLDIGVLCSDREGLSNALLEYMAFGLPVVATDVGGARELVSEGNGLLIPSDNVDALARSLRVLISAKDLRQSLGRTGRTEVERRFSWDRSIGDLQAFYRSVAPR
jgi:glycosyltransferase involved in cell wall biosynthesis